MEDATEEQSEEGTGARRDTAEGEQSDREGPGRKRKREPERRTPMVTWKRRSHTEKDREKRLWAQRGSSSARPRPSTSAADQPAEVALQPHGQMQTGLVNLAAPPLRLLIGLVFYHCDFFWGRISFYFALPPAVFCRAEVRTEGLRLRDKAGSRSLTERSKG